MGRRRFEPAGGWPEALRAADAANETHGQTATRIGCTPTAVKYARATLGPISPRYVPRGDLSVQARQRWEGLFARAEQNGWSDSELARQSGVSRQRVSAARRRYGL